MRWLLAALLALTACAALQAPAPVAVPKAPAHVVATALNHSCDACRLYANAVLLGAAEPDAELLDACARLCLPAAPADAGAPEPNHTPAEPEPRAPDLDFDEPPAPVPV